MSSKQHNNISMNNYFTDMKEINVELLGFTFRVVDLIINISVIVMY